MPVLIYIVTALAAYLFGSIPTAYLVARAKGIDIRAAGSGNIGATNAMRVLGKPVGIFVMLADVLKGFSAVLIGNVIWDSIAPAMDSENVKIVAGIFAVLGHNYTCWLKFKGGKGIATTAGVYLALSPAALGIALAVFILVVLATRYASVASITAAVVLPFAVWFTNQNLFLEIVTIALCMLAIFRHKKNIQRLIAGTENRIGGKTSTTEDAK